MAQVRIMSDDPDEVGDIVAILLPHIRSHPDLAVGGPTTLEHRRGGGRVVFEVLLSRRGRPVRVEAERVDESEQGSAPVRRRRNYRTLPPGPTG